MSRLGEPFPPDLPDLLRLACGQGKLRLNVWFDAEKGHQANLANARSGWTVEYDHDCLEAITKALRIRYGPMLERRRREAAAPLADEQQIDIEEAIAAATADEGDDIANLIG